MFNKHLIFPFRLTNMRSSMDLIDLSEEDIYHLNTQKQIIVGGTELFLFAPNIFVTSPL